MRLAAAGILLVTLLLGHLGPRHIWADSVGDTPVVESVLVTENGTPIGSLRTPEAGSRLSVAVHSGDHQLQAIVQVHAVPGARLMLLTELEDAVVTGLSEEGVVGRVLEGGWVMDARSRQKVHINVVGRHPERVESFDLVQALIITEDQAVSQFRVEARVVRPVVPIPDPVLMGGIGAGVAVIVILAIVVWRRGRRGRQGDWNF